jgi:predicted phage terminase large subunit-like protein
MSEGFFMTQKIITFQKGPQEQFLSSKADLCIFGGGAGGGKTYALLLECLRHIYNPKFHCIIFRRNSTMIRNPGGLWDVSMELFSKFGGIPRQAYLDWTFPSGAVVKFAHLEHSNTVLAYQGSQIPLIMWDEICHFDESQFWYLMSRLRSMSGIPGYIRATCNPDPDSFVKHLISYWIGEDGFPIADRCGRLRWFIRLNDEIIWGDSREDLIGKYGIEHLPKSLTFIPSLITDNKILMEKDPTYLSNLKSLSLVDRERLLSGNWLIRPTAGTLFKKEWFEIVDAVPSASHSVRYWDRACLIADTKITTENGIKLIQDIQIGDKVLTREGFKKVTWSGISKLTTELVSVVFSNGKVLTGTSDHPIYVLGKGWVDLCELNSTDRVFSLMGEPIHYMGIRSTSTVMNGIRKKRSTSIDHYIEMYGKVFMDPYPIASISTIRTETGLTTQLKTWSVYQEKSMLKNINKIWHTKLTSKIQSILKKHTQLFLRRCKNLKNISAKNVVQNLWPGVLKQNIVDGDVKKMSVKNSQVPVYDISVEDCHEFFANGILVHNSTEVSPTNPDPDYTCGLKVIRAVDGIFYVVDMIHAQMSTHKVEQSIKNTTSQDGISTTQWLEVDPGQAGVFEKNYYAKLLAGYDVRFNRPTKNKQERAKAASSQAEAGNIKILRAPWNEKFLSENQVFPDGKHDDIVDCLSGSITVLTQTGVGEFTEEMAESETRPIVSQDSVQTDW